MYHEHGRLALGTSSRVWAVGSRTFRHDYHREMTTSRVTELAILNTPRAWVRYGQMQGVPGQGDQVTYKKPGQIQRQGPVDIWTLGRYGRTWYRDRHPSTRSTRHTVPRTPCPDFVLWFLYNTYTPASPGRAFRGMCMSGVLLDRPPTPPPRETPISMTINNDQPI